MDQVDGRVKAALTRTYNKEVAPYTYSAVTNIKKKKASGADDDYVNEYGGDGDQIDDSDDDGDNDKLENDALIKPKKASGSKASGSSKAGTSGSSRSAGTSSKRAGTSKKK